MHSQRLNEKPLIPWVITHPTGEIQAAHCTCMAGLAESCTHVASMLFWIEIKIRMLKSKTVTDEKAYWMVPTNRAHLEPQEACNIDFTSSKTKMLKLEKSIAENDSNSKCVSGRNTLSVLPPSEEEKDKLYQQLNSCQKKSCILRVLPNYCDTFKPRVMDNKFPLLMPSFYKQENEALSYSELVAESEIILSSIHITETQISNVEKETRGQCTNNNWFRFC